jgi:hypothetical protein
MPNLKNLNEQKTKVFIIAGFLGYLNLLKDVFENVFHNNPYKSLT